MDSWDDTWFANSNRLCRAFWLLYYKVRSWHLPFKRWSLVLKSVPAAVLAFSERNMQSFGLLAKFKILSLKHIGWEFCFVLYKSEFPTNVFIGWLGNSGSCRSQYIWKVSGRGTFLEPELLPSLLLFPAQSEEFSSFHLIVHNIFIHWPFSVRCEKVT